MAEEKSVSLPVLIADIDASQRPASLSSALRVAAHHWLLNSSR
jgi:predicted DNA-binding ribbon-helix-helix protein